MTKQPANVKEHWQHVSPAFRGSGWSVRRHGAHRATRIFATKAEAVAFARNLAKKAGSELYIHGRDGMITDTDSYEYMNER